MYKIYFSVRNYDNGMNLCYMAVYLDESLVYTEYFDKYVGKQNINTATLWGLEKVMGYVEKEGFEDVLIYNNQKFPFMWLEKGESKVAVNNKYIKEILAHIENMQEDFEVNIGYEILNKKDNNPSKKGLKLEAHARGYDKVSGKLGGNVVKSYKPTDSPFGRKRGKY